MDNARWLISSLDNALPVHKAGFNRIFSVFQRQHTQMINDMYAYFTDLPRWHMYAIVLVGYLGYYLMQVVKVS